MITIVSKSDTSPSPPVTAKQAESDLGIKIDRDIDGYRGGWTVAFDGALPKATGLPAKSDYQAAAEWAFTRGAVDVALGHLRLDLANRGAQRLTIRALRAHVIDRSPPIDKTSLNAPSAGANSLVSLLFDLDAGDVVEAQTASRDPLPKPQGPYFAANDVTLDPGETIDLKLSVVARTCYCRYNFEIEVVKDLATQNYEVGDAFGRSFAITGFVRDYGASWMYGYLACKDNGIWRVKPGGDVLPDCSHPAS